jgi:hypothetical protein
MENNLKQRNGCITAWLWVAIIANIGMAIFYAVSMFSAYSTEMALGFGICSIFGVINVLGAILLMRWNKTGFYLFLASSLICEVVNVFVLKMSAATAISSVFAIVIWWAILQTKKDGVSAWSQLETGWDYKHTRHLYQVFSVVGIALFVLTLIAVGMEHKNPYANILSDDSYLDEDTIAVEVVEEEVAVDSVAVADDDVIVVEEPVKPQPKEEKPEKKMPAEDSSKSYETPSPSAKSNDSEDIDKHVRFLKQAIAEGNKEFPQKAAEGMIMKRCYLDGDYVMYLAECDEDLYDMDLLNLNKSEMKKGIRDMISQNTDPMMSYFFKLCIKAHKGMGVKYQGDTTGKSCAVRIPYSELKNL